MIRSHADDTQEFVRVTRAAPRDRAPSRRSRRWAPIGLVIVIALAGCWRAAGSARLDESENRSSVTLVSPGRIYLHLPRRLCLTTSRVGDTVTTAVTRENWIVESNTMGLRPDSSLPNGVRAFLRINRVGRSDTQSLGIGFVVDSFGLAGRYGRATMSAIEVDPEKVDAGGSDRCYSADLVSEIRDTLRFRY